MLPLVALLLLAPAQSPDKLKAIDAALQRYVDSGELSGGVATVARRGGALHTAAVGKANLATNVPMKADTPFVIASMTKPVTAAAVLALVDAGKLGVDDPLEKHLPEFKGQMLVKDRGKDATTLVKPARPVTVRDVLTHTSGLAGSYGPGFPDVWTGRRPYTLRESTFVVSQKPLDFAPGSKWSYCNPGIDTLGRLVEVASGMSYEDYCQKAIFGPLGMTATTFHPSAETVARSAVIYGKGKDGKLDPSGNLLISYQQGARHPCPMGGLYSTAGDMARFYRMLLSTGELDGQRILRPETVAEMTKVQTGDLKAGFNDGMGYGYAVAVVREPKGITENLTPGSFGHGGAFGTHSWADPGQDLVLVLLIARTGIAVETSPYRRDVQAAAVAAVKSGPGR
jgi:CubicO group peptidase (beta-lactamase class C family)